MFELAVVVVLAVVFGLVSGIGVASAYHPASLSYLKNSSRRVILTMSYVAIQLAAVGMMGVLVLWYQGTANLPFNISYQASLVFLIIVSEVGLFVGIKLRFKLLDNSIAPKLGAGGVKRR